MRVSTMLLPLSSLLYASGSLAVVYVDRDAPGPGHDGASWDTAFVTIQAGVKAATPAGEVWVADGTYVEIVRMSEGVRLYGGFLGAEPGGYETSLEERDIHQNVTTIDGAGSGSCVRVASGATVDGFTVTNGCGTFFSGSSSYRGGGFFCSQLEDAATISNNTVTGNTATWGGGLYCYECDVVIADNVIEGNWVTEHGGGLSLQSGIYDLDGNTIRNNRSSDRGGGVWCGGDGDGLMTGNLIEQNWAHSYGGGVFAERCRPILTGNTITGNVAGNGGGLWLNDIHSIIVTQNAITDNQTDEGSGAGLFSSGSAPHVPEITENTVSGNWSIRNGAGLMIAGSARTLVAGNAVTGNTSLKRGGGMYIHASSAAQVEGNLCANNSGYYGGGIDIQDAWPTITRNEIRNNDGVDGGGLRLGDCGAASVIGNVIDGNTAVRGGGILVQPAGMPTFESNTIRGNCATYGAGVAVVDGAEASFASEEVTSNEATSGGGFWTVGSRVTLRSCVVSDNSASRRGGAFDSESGVAQLSETLVSGNLAEYGGGVCAWGTLLMVALCEFEENEARELGGGIYTDWGRVVVTDSLIAANTAGAMGGGVFCWEAQGESEITGNRVVGNAAPVGGGLCFAQNGTPRVSRNLIAGNTADYGAGACYYVASVEAAANNMIVCNGASEFGGGVAVGGGGSLMAIVSNTVAGNAAPQAAGIGCDSGSLHARMNIVAGNVGSGIEVVGGKAVLNYNDVWGNAGDDYVGVEPGATDTSVDPRFVDAANGDFHILPYSACVDAGNNDLTVGSLDYDGDGRSLAGQPGAPGVADIGADEVLIEASECPAGWINAGWNWISIPIEPMGPNAHEVLESPGEHHVKGNLFRWDPVGKNLELVDDDFTDLEVGRGYVLRAGEDHGPAYVGARRRDAPHILVAARGWMWIGTPSSVPVHLTSLLVRDNVTGEIRTALDDSERASPWLNWNLLWWDSLVDTAKLCTFQGGEDDRLRPWYGYRVWSNTEDVTIVFP